MLHVSVHFSTTAETHAALLSWSVLLLQKEKRIRTLDMDEQEDHVDRSSTGSVRINGQQSDQQQQNTGRFQKTCSNILDASIGGLYFAFWGTL